MTARIGTSDKPAKTPDRRSDHKRVFPSVYFAAIKNPEQPEIKIGYASDFTKRRQQHTKSKLGSEIYFRELCVLRANRSDESKLKTHFEKFVVPNRNTDEEFFADKELVDYIRWLRDQYFCWVPDCSECPSLDEMEPIDPSLWMPTPERRNTYHLTH